MAIEEINNSPDLLPDTNIKYYLNDSACDETQGLASLLYQNEFPRSIDAVIGDGCSVACASEARVTEIWEMPQISWGCTSPTLSNKVKFPNFLRTVWSETIHATALSQVLHDTTDWRKVAWISQGEDLFMTLRDSFIEDQAKHPGDPIDVVVDEVYQAAGDGVLDSLVEGKLLKIYNSGVKIWFLAAYAKDGRMILKLAHKIGLTGPGYQLFIMSIGDCILYNPTCPGPNGETSMAEDDPEVLAAVKGAIFTLSYVPILGDVPYDTFASKMMTELKLTSRKEVNPYAAAAYEAVYAYATAVHTFDEAKSIHTHKKDFQAHLKNVSLPGKQHQQRDRNTKFSHGLTDTLLFSPPSLFHPQVSSDHSRSTKRETARWLSIF
jgi:gamma-aminobutyric acid type B receptor